ncbi:MAG: hypothetical protein OEY49_06970 [Candidatus Heimdallarchaeota archaeon]|nr:hypothetical protein [Candidatus Heimdallarchaeota archaeon]
MDKNDNTKKKGITPNIEIKDGKVSEFVDGTADTSVGMVRTVEEVLRAPLRTAGRMIDGLTQGIKQGVDESENPFEAVGKGVIGGVVGTVKGTVLGVKKSSTKVGEGIKEISEGLGKMGDTLISKKNEIKD